MTHEEISEVEEYIDLIPTLDMLYYDTETVLIPIKEVSLMTNEIRWAVLGTGVIANEMAQALAKNGRRICAVGNRTYSKAEDFAKK